VVASDAVATLWVMFCVNTPAITTLQTSAEHETSPSTLSTPAGCIGCGALCLQQCGQRVTVVPLTIRSRPDPSLDDEHPFPP